MVLETFPFAIDGVAVAVNPANAVTSLTKAQVKDVFAGKITNWKETRRQGRSHFALRARRRQRHPRNL